jgi:hypothetical protein
VAPALLDTTLDVGQDWWWRWQWSKEAVSWLGVVAVERCGGRKGNPDMVHLAATRKHVAQNYGTERCREGAGSECKWYMSCLMSGGSLWTLAPSLAEWRPCAKDASGNPLGSSLGAL